MKLEAGKTLLVHVSSAKRYIEAVFSISYYTARYLYQLYIILVD